jgi:tetratricopeptide (TPR) repeat protein
MKRRRESSPARESRDGTAAAAAKPSRLSRGGLRFSIAIGLVTASAITAWLWRNHTREETLLSSIPARPAITGFPAELITRISESERHARRNERPTETLTELAQLYHANGFLTEAASCYRGLTQLDPKNPRWPHRLACLYAGLGELESALSLWQRTLALQADHTPARIRMGDVLAKLNRHADAARAYSAVLEREPDNAFALAGLARIDCAEKRWSAARDRLEKAAARSSGRIGADLLATVYEQLGDQGRATALRARAKSSGSFHDPPDPWMDEIFADCYDVYRLTVAAGFADHAGDAAAAQRWIDRALKLAPTDANALFQNGSFALARRDYEKARANFESCVRAAPQFADGWVRLINVHLLLGNTDAAERALVQGLAHCPTSPTLHLERANRHAAAGRYADAVKEFEETLRLRPTDADALVKLAPVYFRLERIEDGVAALRRALVAEPEHPAALTMLALHAIGTGDERAAREWLRRVRLQPRITAETSKALVAEFRKQFGGSPE